MRRAACCSLRDGHSKRRKSRPRLWHRRLYLGKDGILAAVHATRNPTGGLEAKEVEELRVEESKRKERAFTHREHRGRGTQGTKKSGEWLGRVISATCRSPHFDRGKVNDQPGFLSP